MRLPASVVAALLWTLGLVSAGAAEEAPPAALWTALRSGGHIAVMRHAEAPMSGTGGTLGFRTLLVDALESVLDLFAMKGLIFLERIFNDVLTKLVYR